jgi:hypothetical protein
MSVLLVEDDESIAIVITAALEAEGFEVTRCDSVAERDRLLAARAYDALVTDVKLTDGDGIESLPAVRAMIRRFGRATRAPSNISPSRSTLTNWRGRCGKRWATPAAMAPSCWAMTNRAKGCRWWAVPPRCRRSIA